MDQKEKRGAILGTDRSAEGQAHPIARLGLIQRSYHSLESGI